VLGSQWCDITFWMRNPPLNVKVIFQRRVSLRHWSLP